MFRMSWRVGSGVGLVFIVVLTVCLTVFLTDGTDAQERPVWTYQCQNGRCEKLLLKGTDEAKSLAVCKILCDPYSMIWPRPSGKFIFGEILVPVDPELVSINSVGFTGPAKDLVDKAGERFKGQLSSLADLADRPKEKKGGKLDINITIKDPSVVSLALDTNEGYTINVAETSVGKIGVTISADTFFGARHGLETLSQLAISDIVSFDVLLLRDVSITDGPVFTYRGINLDTARNYFSVDSIKRTLEGMAVNKLNTFHWHLTDSHSWPFVSDSYPQLSRYGAYTQKKVYTPANIRDIVEYGRVRGVRVVPEIDAPAHVGEGFQFAEPDTLVCYKAQPWTSYCVEPPCGQFNPGSEQVYDILGGVYGDLMRLFDSDIFHMGGDEVNLNCWNSSTAVTDYMAANGMDVTKDGFNQLWDRFQTRAYKKLVDANGGKKMPVILWTSGLTELGSVEKYLDNDTYIIEIWTKGDDPLIAELVNKGFRVIFSNYDALYFDCGFGGWVAGGNNWCSPYIGWDKVYENSPYRLLAGLNVSAEAAKKLTLGAEASLWSEQADESSLDSKLWPRAAALAERLWADPQEDWRSAEPRMLNQRERLQKQGFHPNRLQPEWCHQNDGYCPLTA